jgi:hypothetical protein
VLSERRYRRCQFAITGVKQLALTAEGALSCTTASSAEKSRGEISEAAVPRERPGSVLRACRFDQPRDTLPGVHCGYRRLARSAAPRRRDVLGNFVPQILRRARCSHLLPRSDSEAGNRPFNSSRAFLSYEGGWIIVRPLGRSFYMASTCDSS